MSDKIIFTDTHAHLDFPDFAQELPEVLDRAASAGVPRIITIGTDLESSRRAILLAERFEEVFAVVGWHPSNVETAPEDIRPALRELGQHPKVVAIGETGLDYYRLPSTRPGGTLSDDDPYKKKQSQLFSQHLEIAQELGLNCVIHQRHAANETIDQLRPFAPRVRGVFHCFVDTPEIMRQVLDLGSLVSFTGITTFKNAAAVRETLASTPVNALMLETDCPYLAPVPYRGKRSEPAHVREIAQVVAQVKSVTLEELSQITESTVQQFFPKLKPA